MTKKFIKGILVFLALVVLISFLNSLSKGKLPIKSKIGIIRLKGPITSETAEDIISLIDKALNRSDIKGIILRIESPGGAVAPSQEIYNFILKSRKKKKIYASVGTVAASGAYYVASACEKIFADAGSITGSIGVIFSVSDIKKLLDKIGITPHIFKSGRFKDMGSPFRKPTEEEKMLIEEILKDIHEQFIQDVAKARKMDIEELRKLADGRIFTGKKAKELGLIDGIAGLEEVIAKLSNDLGYSEKLNTINIEKKQNFFDRLGVFMIRLIKTIKIELETGGIV